ncbi:MAG: hydroxyisourate hydrolase [Acidimicrobiia bacterium]|jgi:5-hydroxyisourate hydrolase
MTTLSTHVLDTSTGDPAIGLGVHLSRRVDDEWERVGEGATDTDGRYDFGEVSMGTHRLGFETGAHGNVFYPYVHVVFEVDADRPHYHIPLLLSQYGLTTYRGS